MTDQDKTDQDRRTMIKVMAGGLAGLSVLGSASLTAATASAGEAKLNVNGSVPLLPELSKVMPASPVLMNALASEFAPTAAKLATQQSYWIALNGWITNRLSGPIMDGKVSTAEIGEQAWATLASAYWGGMELREHWGMPPAMERLGIKITAPFAELQQKIAANMTLRINALNAGGKACLQLLPALMHEDTTEGTVWSMAYNAGAQVVKTEDPPIGQRRPHRTPRPAAVRINTRDFMRADYDLPTPQYLKEWRSAFERAVVGNPDAFEKAIVGEAGQKNLREIWTHGVGHANTTWGGGANDIWSNEYFDDVLHWSTVVNFGLEAVGLAAFVAVLNQDEDAAQRAVMGNTLYVGMSSGWLMGFLDTAGKLPTVV